MNAKFTALENSVLRRIAQQAAREEEALLAQLGAALVTGRANTGAGLYLDLAVPKASPMLNLAARTIGNVFAEIEELEHGMVLCFLSKMDLSNFSKAPPTASRPPTLTLATSDSQFSQLNRHAAQSPRIN